MSEYKVEKDITPQKEFNVSNKYPFKSMGIGDSFNAGEKSPLIRSRMISAVRTFERNNEGKFFKVASHLDHMRVWRIK